jgi:hypothetical protein
MNGQLGGSIKKKEAKVLSLPAWLACFYRTLFQGIEG